MINHGPFTEHLMTLKGESLTGNMIADIIAMTRGGVIKEGGPLAANVEPNWRVDSVMTGMTYKTPGVREEGSVAAPKQQPEPTVQRDSGFRFGAGSERELVGVTPRLIAVTRLALKYSLQDFTVYDGIRSLKEQAQYVKAGTSKTMQSKHLQGLAVDLVPWINGKPVWDWDGCYKIACAMDLAATELGIAHEITWGGAWDRRLSDFGGDPAAYAIEVQAYMARHPGPDFLDGPHFEILP